MLYWIWIPLSVLLHLITIFGLIILYQRYQTLKAGQMPDMTELKQQLHQYIRQIEKENEAYYQKVVNYINERDMKQQKETKNQVQHRVQDIHKDQRPPHARIDQVIKLLKQGYSHQEIARQLNMGVGEIQLMANLYVNDAD
jgi:DNA-binding NarL/FixJ family response regulator